MKTYRLNRDNKHPTAQGGYRCDACMEPDPNGNWVEKSEADELREAVRVLGAECSLHRRWASIETVCSASDATDANPIAAAAVKGGT